MTEEATVESMKALIKELRLSAFHHANRSIDEDISQEDMDWNSMQSAKFSAAADLIERLTSERDEARAKAIEECAKVAEARERHAYGETEYAKARADAAFEIRALLGEKT